MRGCVLGAIEDPTLVDSVVELAPGDTLMFVTDGVEETRGAGGGVLRAGARPRSPSSRRCARAGGATAAALIEALRGDLDEFRGDQAPRDDVVILAVRFEGL